jgi:hypothetical protein
MWHSSIADVAALLRESLPVSSQPLFMVFTHQQTASYEGACVPKLSLKDI